MGKERENKHYKAFISYSHDNEAFGSWLHKELEKYKIPKKLREDYPNLPKTLYPIFRDRYELNAGDDLGVEIPKALENSDALIVVCSTKSADSKWVNKEIIDFKMMHGEDRVFPIIVDGEPFAKESDKFEDELECFPEALKYKVDGEGNLTDIQTDKLASDFNKSEDGEELAKLKLIAGVLGVPFGEFYRRDEEQKRRDRNKAIGIWGIVSLIIIGFAIFSWIQRDMAIKSEEIAKNRLQENMIQQGLVYKNHLNNPLKAKLLFANAVKVRPNTMNEKQSKILYNSVNKIKLKNIFKHKEYVYGTQFSKDEKEILSWSADGTVRLWNKKTGKELLSLGHTSYLFGVKFTKDEKEILSWSSDGTARLWDKKTGEELLLLKHDNQVRGAMFSADENEILTWDLNYKVRLWNKKTAKEIFILNFNNFISEVKFSKDEKYIFILSHNTVMLCNKKTGKVLIVLTHNEDIEGIEFSKDEKEILTWSRDNTVKLWIKQRDDRLFSLKHANDRRGVRFSKRSEEILVLSDNIVILEDKKSGKELLILKHNTHVNTIAKKRG